METCWCVGQQDGDHETKAVPELGEFMIKNDAEYLPLGLRLRQKIGKYTK